jgi:hypothetical protein
MRNHPGRARWRGPDKVQLGWLLGCLVFRFVILSLPYFSRKLFADDGVRLCRVDFVSRGGAGMQIRLRRNTMQRSHRRECVVHPKRVSLGTSSGSDLGPRWK